MRELSDSEERELEIAAEEERVAQEAEERERLEEEEERKNPEKAPLPPGWSEHWDDTYTRNYYYDSYADKSVWERPPSERAQKRAKARDERLKKRKARIQREKDRAQGSSGAGGAKNGSGYGSEYNPGLCETLMTSEVASATDVIKACWKPTLVQVGAEFKGVFQELGMGFIVDPMWRTLGWDAPL